MKNRLSRLARESGVGLHNKSLQLSP
jgi:hypothetical protein